MNTEKRLTDNSDVFRKGFAGLVIVVANVQGSTGAPASILGFYPSTIHLGFEFNLAKCALYVLAFRLIYQASKKAAGLDRNRVSEQERYTSLELND